MNKFLAHQIRQADTSLSWNYWIDPRSSGIFFDTMFIAYLIICIANKLLKTLGIFFDISCYSIEFRLLLFFLLFAGNLPR